MATRPRRVAPIAFAVLMFSLAVVTASGRDAARGGLDACGEARVFGFMAQQQEDRTADAALETKSAEQRAEENLQESITEVEALPHFAEMPTRWYRDPWALMPGPTYEINEPGDRFWDPYRQNVLKGDFPIIGEDIFLRLTLTEKITAELRNVPTPAGLTGPNANNASFFGDGEQFFFTAKTALSVDLFRGQEAFRPVEWRLRVTPVFDFSALHTEELGAVSPNIRNGTDRDTSDIALQEALLEIHLLDLNDRFDFVSSEVGIFGFRSDFRGFIFDDLQAGARIFGTADENKWQYNAVFFNMLEKDTNSELNQLEWRDQQVLILNLYRQDFIIHGYTAQISFHWNHDQRSSSFNKNDFLVRPQPIGLAREKQVDAYYLGFAGEGHWGRFNITHAFYHVFGHEENNALAAKDTDINAQFLAVEVSYDIDWARIRLYGMYASGDDDPLDEDAEGFDAIVDAPAFAGGEFSFWNRQEIRLLGVGLNPRLSFLPDLTSSKFEGQANFVNPGIMILGAAFDAEITPEWRAQVGVNYLRFSQVDSLELYLEVENIDNEIGWEIFFGTTYRPLLTNNIIINAGAAVFFPGDGLEKIYQDDETLYSFFLDVTLTY